MSTFDVPLPPATYFAISSATFFIAIQLSHRARIWLAPLLFGSAVLSMYTSTYLSWVFNGAPSYWNLLQCVWIHHALSVLFIEPFHFPLAAFQTKDAWILAYKVYNDPQHQLKWSTYLQKRRLGSTPLKKRFSFALQRAAKVTTCWLVQLWIIGPGVQKYSQITLTDFAPSYHPLFRRLLWADFGPDFTTREIRFRSIWSVYWIWLAYLMLDTANILLSIFFVAILRIDTPEEWPPLFGSPLHGSSLRGFWGKFWHRLAGPSCSVSGRFITRRISGLAPHSTYEKLFIAFWNFFVSGVIHAIADWQGGEHVMPMGEMQFWLSNFAGAAAETIVMAVVKRALKKSNGTLGRTLHSSVVRKTIGFVWVFSFFFWIAPSWQYPKFWEAMKPLRRAVLEDPAPYPGRGLFEESDESFLSSLFDGSTRADNWTRPKIEFVSLVE